MGCGPSHSARVCSFRAHLLNLAHGPSRLHGHYGEGGPTGAEHVTVIFRELRELGRSMYLSHSSVLIEIYPTQPHITSRSSAVQCAGWMSRFCMCDDYQWRIQGTAPRRVYRRHAVLRTCSTVGERPCILTAICPPA